MIVLSPALLLVAAVAGSSGDPCDRRADIVAVRAADDVKRAALLASAEADVARLDTRARGCAAAVAAEAAIRSGDRQRTLRLLDIVVAELPETSPAIAPHRALLLVELGQREAARAVIDTISTRSDWRQRLELMVTADADAGPALRRRASRDPDAIGVLCDRGDAASCTTLLLRYAGHPRARAIEDTPGQVPLSQAAVRTQALVSAARPHRAIAEGMAFVAASTGATRDAVVEVLATALWRAERTAEALPLTELWAADPAVKRVLSAPLARARAKTFARLGRFADAARVWTAIRDDDTVAADDRAEAAFFVAFSAVEANDADAALAAFSAGAPHTKNTSWQEQADWYSALLLLTVKGDAVAADALLRPLLTSRIEPRKYRYWHARALDALGDTKAATAERKGIVAESSTDWYGLLAHRALGAAPIKGVVVDANAVARAAPDDADANLVRLLFALGFDDEAKQGCRVIAQGKRAPSLAQVALCQQVDDPTFGWRHGGFFTPRQEVRAGRLVTTSTWRVSYARPWKAVVDDAAVAGAIPTSMIMAIMRSESGFDPDAASAAGAKGLMQLLPTVARTTASFAGLPPGVVDDLSAPRNNISLGAHLLGRLRAEHGSLLQAAAAYNAGPDQAASWATRFGTLEPALYVERIPFKETRNYVKRVLAVEAVYRGLDGGDVTLDLPTSITPALTFTPLPYDE